jgi:hypothetical protein
MPMSSRDTFTVELHPADESRDSLLRAIQSATEDRYSIVGEMAAPDDELQLLARSNERGHLVTLALRPTSWRGSRIHVLTVAPVRRAPEIGAAQPHQPRPTMDVSRHDSSRDLPRADIRRQDIPRQDIPLQSTSRHDISTGETPRVDHPVADVPRTDVPRQEESPRVIHLPPRLELVPESTPREVPVLPVTPPSPIDDDRPDERPVERTAAGELSAAGGRLARHPGDELQDDAEIAWADEMRAYSGWRSGSKLLVGALAAIVLFIVLVALATQSSNDVVAGAGAVDEGATPVTAADSEAPVAGQPLAAAAIVPEPAAVSALTETPSPAPAATPTREATTTGRSTPRATSPTGARRSARPAAGTSPDRVTSEAGGTIADPGAAFGGPPATTTAVPRSEKPASGDCTALIEARSDEALPVCRRAALLGNAEAQSHIGRAYESGAGVRRNIGEATAWFRKAAAQGHSWSQNHLGWMYAGGEGVARDDQQAVRWFRMAAERGNAEAQYNLGFMYQRGRGVPRSTAQAAEWYRRAAAQGNQSAIRALRSLGG